ncbi:hypothetical protein SEPCBS57363_005562 [Sporothrix epigloea]|uniref:Uncharacterized protein n=1 Tax=Sporothrix epigloea TaxID=1892477 RepID=A0ABP0E063_9PEZI
MTRVGDMAPPPKPDEKVCDENAVNDPKPLAVKSAVQGPVIVDKVTPVEDAGHEEDDEGIPESQPAEFAVPAVQPMKRQKTGVETSVIIPESFVGTPKKAKKSTELDSSPPRAPPPTPVIPQLEFNMPAPSEYDDKFHAMTCEKLQQNKDNGTIYDSDAEDIDAAHMVKSEPETPPGASPAPCNSPCSDCEPEATTNGSSPESSVLSTPKDSNEDDGATKKRRSPRINKD